MKEKGFAPVLVLVVVVLGAIAIVSIAYFQLRPKPTIQPPAPTQTPSSAQTDETAGWKVYIGDGDGISFKLRYPTHFKTVKEEFDFVTHLIGNDQSLYEHGHHKDGGISIGIANSEEMTAPALIALKRLGREGSAAYQSDQDVLFSGVKTKKITLKIPEENIGIITYYIHNQPPIDSNHHFVFDCRFFPSSNNELQKTCETIASTFEFER